MEKKYILTDKFKRVEGRFVYQIQAVRDIKTERFGVIRKGTLGGFISNEDNLSHEGSCWVHARGAAVEHARITENAQICQGLVSNSATVSGNAMVGYRLGSEFPQVCGNASVSDNAVIQDHAIVSGFAVIKDNAKVSDFARVDDEVVMEDDTNAFHYACLFGNAHLKDSTFVCGHCKIGGEVTLVDHCCVTDDRTLVGNQELSSCEHRKYRLLKDDTIEVDGRTLYRILAVEDGPFCHYGEKGGYVESDKNLSQGGACWIKYPMYAYGDTIINSDTLLAAKPTLQ